MIEIEQVILNGKCIFQSDRINKIARHFSLKLKMPHACYLVVSSRAFINAHKTISDLDFMVPPFAYGSFQPI